MQREHKNICYIVWKWLNVYIPLGAVVFFALLGIVLICGSHADKATALEMCLIWFTISFVLAVLVLFWGWLGRHAVGRGFGNGDNGYNGYFIAVTILSIMLAVFDIGFIAGFSQRSRPTVGIFACLLVQGALYTLLVFAIRRGLYPVRP